MIDKTCKFFLSEEGCKFGKSCYYSHENLQKKEQKKSDKEVAKRLIQVCYLVDCNKILGDYKESAK